MTEKIRVAVIGAGYFGKFHALHYKDNPDCDLVAVVDGRAETGEEVATQNGARYVSDYRSLVGQVDAVSIAVPTHLHCEVGKFVLENNIHALIEKPITDNVETAAELTRLAEDRDLRLQVGHIERFSATFRAISPMITSPLFIESYRIAPFKDRANDVDVVLDLMIHDIDAIQGLVNSPVEMVHAVGTPIVNPTEDLANARIVFESGCVANVTASRVSYKTERRIRIFQPNSYIIGDFDKNHIDSYSVIGDLEKEGLGAIRMDSRDIEKEDSLANEIAEFLNAIREKRSPLVTGRDGSEALRVAKLVTASISEHRQKAAGLLNQ
ncbi:MAG: Gfo/Idh/MocA family protein [Methyloligellaceae bacterium]